MQQAKVVIVDSHPVLRDGLSSQLSDLPDITVVTSLASLNSLGAVVHSDRPSVVVVDFEIARADRSQALAQMQLLTDAPAVVLLLGECDPETGMKALRSGAAALVLRESPIHDLAMAIRWAQRGEMWIAPALLSVLLDSVRSESVETGTTRSLAGLSARELEVLELMTKGVGPREMASRLSIALNTVRTHTRNIHVKLNVHSNVAAVSVALGQRVL